MGMTKIMINLLPPIEKIRRKHSKDLKLIWILGILVVSSILCFSLILLSIKFYISNQIEAKKDLISMEKERNSQVQILQEKIKSVNGTLLGLNNFYRNQFNFSTFLEQVFNLLLPGMHIEIFSYQSESLKVTISGYAANIDDAYEFREKIKGQKNFKEVNFSIPDWLQEKGTNFRISFVLEK
jgi:hypothetical protein